MTSVSATFNGSVVNILSVNGDGNGINIVYVDSARNLKVSRGFIDNTGTAVIGTSATVN